MNIFVQALDGFLFVVNTEGRVEYVTDNITQYINYTKDDVLGKDIYNIIHHGDHNTFMPSLLPMQLGWYIFRILSRNNKKLQFCEIVNTLKNKIKNDKE